MHNCASKFSMRICTAWLLMLAVTHTANANDELWGTLKEGGKVVLMRHAPVERGAEAGSPLNRDPSCKHERNLSDQGKLDAQQVGNRFSDHGIPIERVFHSPFCRTTETARLAFGDTSPEETLALLEVLSPTEAADRTEQLNQLIGSFSGEGNLILVTHEPNINAVSFEPVKHLDFVVIEPAGDGDFEELGVIRFTASE